MAEFGIISDIDSVSFNTNSFIPQGSLIMKAISPTLLTNYQTDLQCLNEGVVPCDGRSLSSYTFRSLHSIISNLYGGTAYQNGVTNIISSNATFLVPSLRSAKYYIGGATEAQKETPAIFAGTNAITHNHAYSVDGPVSIANATGSNHSHSVNHTTGGLSGDHVHLSTGSYTGNTGQQPGTTYTQSKADGSGGASASNHSHNVAFNFSANSNGASYNADHTHSGSSNSASQSTTTTHTHTTTTQVLNSTGDQFVLSGSGNTAVLPFVNVLYFIKI